MASLSTSFCILLKQGRVQDTDDSGRQVGTLLRIRIDSQGSVSFSHILIPPFEAYKFSAFSALRFLQKSDLYVYCYRNRQGIEGKNRPFCAFVTRSYHPIVPVWVENSRKKTSFLCLFYKLVLYQYRQRIKVYTLVSYPRIIKGKRPFLCLFYMLVLHFY